MTRGGKREGAGRKGPPGRTRSLRLPAALWEALEAHAEADGVSVNALAREALGALVGRLAEEKHPARG